MSEWPWSAWSPGARLFQSLRHCRTPTTYWKTWVLWYQGEHTRVDHSMVDKMGVEGSCRRGEFRGSPCEIGSSSGNSIGAADVHTLHQWYQREHQLQCEVVCRWLPHIQAHPVSAGCNSPARGPRPAVQLDASVADVIQPRQMLRKKHPVISTYRMLGTTLKHYDHHPYLGAGIWKDMDWGEYVKNTVTKAHRSLNLHRRNLSGCSSETKEKAFATLVRPVLEYAVAVWDPYQANHVSQLESVQRKAARFVCADYRRYSSVTRMMNNLGWRTLQERRWAYSIVQPINKLLASYHHTLQRHNQEPGPATTSNTSLPKLTPMSTSSVSSLDVFEHGTSYHWPLSKRTLWTHSRQLSITPSELETCIWFPQETTSSDRG